jgi:predicted DNA-binding transcriptional regulator AlpA
MARQIVNIKGLAKLYPFTENQIYKLIRRDQYPLPYKKLGKRLLFDIERVEKWFDSLPGKDNILSF